MKILLEAADGHKHQLSRRLKPNELKYIKDGYGAAYRFQGNVFEQLTVQEDDSETWTLISEAE